MWKLRSDSKNNFQGANEKFNKIDIDLDASIYDARCPLSLFLFLEHSCTFASPSVGATSETINVQFASTVVATTIALSSQLAVTGVIWSLYL